jgi:arabinofuranosyltransferase
MARCMNIQWWRALAQTRADRSTLALCVLALCTAVGFGVWLCVSFWSFTVDDTFITLRYARNLAHGHGLTWNPGEAPAEGYTSFAWVVLTAPFHFWADDAEGCAKVLSVLATVCGVTASALFALDVLRAERLWVRAVGVAFVALWQSLQIGTSVHAVSGMDTSLFTTTIIVLSWCSSRVLRHESRRNFRAFALGCLLCGLTRPEGNVFSFVLATATWLSLRSEARRPFTNSWLVLFLLPASVYFVWRFAYYGQLFPLPFYVKAVDTHEFFAGAREAYAFLYDVAVISPAFTLLALAGVVRGPSELRPVWWASLALFLFFLKPVPLMAYNHRYLHPLIPVLAVAGAAGIPVVLHFAYARAGRRASRGVVVTLVALACVGAAAFTTRALPANRADKSSYALGLRRAHKELGHELAARASTTGERRIALLDVGAVAYYARDWSVLDTFGLTDPTIALAGRDRTDYVLQSNPTYIVFVSSDVDEVKLVFPHEQPLLGAAQAAGYRRSNTREFVSDYHLTVFEKPADP